jgi:hypothetical protein
MPEAASLGARCPVVIVPLSRDVLCDAVLDPAFDIAPSEAKVFTDAKSGWALASVSPCVDGCYWHIEMVGEIIHCEQPIERCHGVIICFDPLSRM